MKKQKGFIQIPLLLIIIASTVIVSAGAGYVLYKQEKLGNLGASISQLFGENRSTELKTDKETATPSPEFLAIESQEPSQTPSSIISILIPTPIPTKSTIVTSVSTPISSPTAAQTTTPIQPTPTPVPTLTPSPSPSPSPMLTSTPSLSPSPSSSPSSTPSPTPIPTPIPASTSVLEFSSVSISSTNLIMTFNWTTNKPAESRVFLSGGNISKAYQSESGLSTRHIVNAYNLSADTNYSYEIESIAGSEVEKKQGSFSTKPDIHIFNVYENYENSVVIKIMENGTLDYKQGLRVEYQTGKDSNSLKIPSGISINASASSLNFNKTEITGPKTAMGAVFADFLVPVKKDGTYPIVFSANGATYNYNLIVNVIDDFKNDLCKSSGRFFCDSKDFAFVNAPSVEKISEIKEFSILDPSQWVGKIHLFNVADIRIDNVELEMNDFVSGPVGTFMPTWQRYWDGYDIGIGYSGKKAGTYTIIVKDIVAYGRETNTKKVFSGLPITFTFTIK